MPILFAVGTRTGINRYLLPYNCIIKRHVTGNIIMAF
jgi:hypothetical protein